MTQLFLRLKVRRVDGFMMFIAGRDQVTEAQWADRLLNAAAIVDAYSAYANGWDDHVFRIEENDTP